NATSSFIIQRDGIRLLNEGGTAGPGGRSRSVGSDEAGSAVGLAGAILASPAIMFVGVGMESKAAEIRRNFAMKELQPTMVVPEDVKFGFVYFRLPKAIS